MEDMKTMEKMFLKDDNFEMLWWNEEINKYIITISSKKTTCKCPKCGKESSKYHGTCVRTIQDTPIHNTETWLKVWCHEFECENEECKVITFTEDLPFARKNMVKTNALIQLILSIAIFTSSSTASLILSFLGVKVSPDTVDNILKNVKTEDDVDIKEVGIDDVASRKGMEYLTAIYDLRDHHIVALLKGRDAETLKEWLKTHKKITLVARDRASAYASAISEVLPNCTQVADRYHLFPNLIDYLIKLFYAEMPERICIKDDEIIDEPKKVSVALKDIDNEVLKSFEYDNSQPKDENGNTIKVNASTRDVNSSRYKKLKEKRIQEKKVAMEVRDMARGITSDEIPILAKLYSMPLSKVQTYLNMSEEEVPVRSNPNRKTKMTDYYNIIYKMLVDGIAPDYIVAYVLEKGCTASYMHIKDIIKFIAKNNNLQYDNEYKIYSKMVYPDDVLVIYRSDLLKCILTLDEKRRNKDIVKYLDKIKEKYPIVSKVEGIFKDFHNTIFSKEPDLLDVFIELYSDVIPEFCNGLKKDIAAVKNAISLDINSGFVEGNNNKFKLIKRIIYGKQKICNLFKRCYLFFLVTTDGFKIDEIVDDLLQDYKSRS